MNLINFIETALKKEPHTMNLILFTFSAFVFRIPYLLRSKRFAAGDDRIKHWMDIDKFNKFLEDVSGKDAIEWVMERNKATTNYLGDPLSKSIYNDILKIMDSKERIPYVRKIGDFYYNFWQDDVNPRGILRRISLEDYEKATPVWETVLDVDALGKEENQSWVYKGHDVYTPDDLTEKPTRTMIHLSPGGSDAHEMREFDLTTKSFVATGFKLPVAKSHISWLNKETLLVGSNFDGVIDGINDSLTDSGYPRIVCEWKRDTPLSDAREVFSGEKTDVSVSGYMSSHCGFKMEFRSRAMTFYTAKYWLRWGEESEWNELQLQDDATITQFQDQLLITLRSDWETASDSFPKGSILAVSAQDFIASGTSAIFTALFTPTPRITVDDMTITKNFVVLSTLENVMSRLRVWRFERPTASDTESSSPGGYIIQQFAQVFAMGASVLGTLGSPTQSSTQTQTQTQNEVPSSPSSSSSSKSRRESYITPSNEQGSTITKSILPTWVYIGSEEEAVIRGCHVSAVDSDRCDLLWVTSSSFLEPTSLRMIDISKGLKEMSSALKSEPLKALPAQFNAEGLVEYQGEAISKDGTVIPYFLIRRADSPDDGSTPTLLYGYGGFEIPLLPSYMSVSGKAWLEAGGAYVSANIRGGSEFGPMWHQSALRENRQRCYDDFIAVAENLISRGVTSVPRLGIRGGSNGGLLMGNMFVQRPDLFGAVVCEVPLLDMRRYSKLLAGASWMAEYGDPETSDWEFLRNYSAYHNIDPTGHTAYPPLLVKTSTKDDRVHPYHARAFVKRLLDLSAPDNEDDGSELHKSSVSDACVGRGGVFYYENMEGGHGGAADNKQHAYMTVLHIEFLKRTIGKGVM